MFKPNFIYWPSEGPELLRRYGPFPKKNPVSSGTGWHFPGEKCAGAQKGLAFGPKLGRIWLGTWGRPRERNTRFLGKKGETFSGRPRIAALDQEKKGFQIAHLKKFAGYRGGFGGDPGKRDVGLPQFVGGPPRGFIFHTRRGKRGKKGPRVLSEKEGFREICGGNNRGGGEKTRKGEHPQKIVRSGKTPGNPEGGAHFGLGRN